MAEHRRTKPRTSRHEGGLVNKQYESSRKRRRARGEAGVLARLALAGVICCVFGVVAFISWNSASARAFPRGQDKNGAGITFSKQATPREVGLPAYPGAKLRKDEKDDSASVQMGLWGSTFGFKLAVMKLESNDAPEKIAEFYKKALAKYGTVLNCSEPSQKPSAKDSNKLECGEDKPQKGGVLFKEGTKGKRHVVGIQSNGQGSLLQLMYLEARCDAKDKK